MIPPNVTSNQPLWREGIISAIKVKVIGSSPPADNKILARRPNKSAMRPHKVEPDAVPYKAINTSDPAASLLI